MREFIRTRLRRALVGIPLIIALLAMMVSVTGCQSLFKPAAAAPSTKAAAVPPKRVPTGAEKFASATTSLTVSLDAAAKALKAGKRDAIALKGVADFAAALPRLNAGVQADFAKTRGVLAKIKSPAKDAIEAKVEKQYAEREATLAAKLAAVGRAGTTSELASAVGDASKWLASITPEQPYQPLGTQLPHRIVNAHAGPPILGTSIAPAYSRNTKGAEASKLPITPTESDTSETVEVQFSPEISSLVASLGADPVRMYEYVRNTIDFEPYYGSRKGGTETFLEGSGNDIDTASLLIALYRKAGIPARYVSGVVDIPIAQAENWVGVETPEAAAKLFSAGGVPTKAMLSGGKVKQLEIEHTWAEVYVPYEDYRGSSARSGPMRWVPLDASFKEYDDVPQVNVGKYLAEAQRDAYSSVAASATSVDASGFVTIDYQQMSSAANTLTAEATAALADATESRETSTMLGRRGPAQTLTGALPNTLPLSVRVMDSEWAAVPDALETKLHMSVENDSGDTALSCDVPLAKIGEGKIVLGFSPASSADQSVRAAYASIEDVPAYLMSTTPELLVGSDPTIGNGRAPLGSGATFHVATVLGGVEDPLCATPVTVGGMYAVGLDLGRVAPARVESSAAEFTKPFKQALAGGAISPLTGGGFFGGMLHSGALLYFKQVDDAQDVIAGSFKVRRFRQLSGLVTGTDLEAVNALGAPVAVRCPGLLYDVGSDVSSRASMSAESTQSLVACNLASGAVSSSIEGLLWRALLGPASQGISAISSFQQCLIAGRRIAAIDASNVDQTLAQLVDLPPGVATDIRNQVAAGRVVSLPTRAVNQGGWTGIGYAVVDPASGDAGFMLSGGLAGGVAGIEEGLWTMMAMVLAWGPVNPAIDIVAWITAQASLGASFGEAAGYLAANASGRQKDLLLLELAGMYTLCANTLVGILAGGAVVTTADGVVSPEGLYTSPCVAMAVGVASLAVGMTFWISVQLIEMGVG